MSRAWVVLMGAALCFLCVCGCCGGGPSHKCDFTPPGHPTDGGGSDTGLACGTMFCQLPQVCCVKKAPLIALCIDQVDFIPDHCEIADLPCAVPKDCPAGLICCVAYSPVPSIGCRPAQLCPADGISTFFACESNVDCPPATPTCYEVGSGGGDDGGVVLRVCTP